MAATIRGARQPSQEDDHMPNRTCSIEGCERPHKGHGYCRPHLERWKRNGDPGGPQITVYRPGATCSAEGCDHKVEAHGLCNMHYKRTRPKRRGKRLSRSELSAKIATHSAPQGDCLVWVRSRNKAGYGIAFDGYRTLVAHRLAWMVHYDVDLPSDTHIDHICGNRACIKIGHLRLATRQQNNEYLTVRTSTNTSGFRGVSWSQSHKGWMAAVCKNKTNHYLGTYSNKYEAAIMAAKKRLELFTFQHELDIKVASMTPMELEQAYPNGVMRPAELVGKHHPIQDTLDTAMTRKDTP